MRAKTIAWSGRSARSTSTSVSALSPDFTSTENCSTVSTVSVGRLDLDRDRVVEVAVGQRADRRRHRRAEERGLAAVGREREDPLDVLQEAEVEHLVGLVEDDEAAAVQDQRGALDEVEHAPDRAHDDRARRRAAAPAGSGSARRRRRRPRRRPCAAPYARSACVTWMHSSRVGVSTSAWTSWLGGVDVLEDRQAERGRLARARLRLADHVAPLEQRRGWPAPGSGWAARSRRPAARARMDSERPRSAKAVT